MADAEADDEAGERSEPAAPDPTGRYRPPDEEAVVEALGDAANRCILAACAQQARPVKEIAEGCDLALATAYRHVNDLAADGLLFLERSAISAEGKRVDLYRAAVRRVEIAFGPGGTEVRYELVEDAADRLRRVWMDIKERRRGGGQPKRPPGGRTGPTGPDDASDAADPDEANDRDEPTEPTDREQP